MRLHDLKPAVGSHRDRKRLGRGNASGQGTTAGKGTKGQKARAGGLKAGFRGISSRNQRMAKRRGFTNIFKVEYQPINVSSLEALGSGVQVTLETLRAAGLVRGKDTLAKILGNGDLTVPVHVIDLKVSASARQKIEAVGGTVTGGEDVETAEAVAPESAPVDAVAPTAAAPDVPVLAVAPEEVAPADPGVTENAAPATTEEDLGGQ
jgi:large subunit ribosomal protein L15